MFINNVKFNAVNIYKFTEIYIISIHHKFGFYSFIGYIQQWCVMTFINEFFFHINAINNFYCNVISKTIVIYMERYFPLGDSNGVRRTFPEDGFKVARKRH